MHALLLTVLALAGGDGYPMSTHMNAQMAAQPAIDSQVAQAGFHGGGCDSCGGGNSKYKQPHWMMPQSCYNPKYGCYGADRHMNRYPAFSGTYYRRPYNYRNVFDYPWHAEMHEPTSFFSYHVNAAQQPRPAAQQLGPANAQQQPFYPAPTAESASQGIQTLRR
ncbi:hypothetical protein [Anatilimnocola floriformis]|uniref:hypothetical protein n=1 Tax=Anatilimnocola floriformis TaxID=2948575 RepID=UPI0020C3281D|nr:hypothetical protein [Anatilimnocola floriformis]